MSRESQLTFQQEQILQDFIQAEKLPDKYITLARQWFIPLANDLVAQHTLAKRPIIIGINGSQGSGKSTVSSLLALLLNKLHGLKTIDLSIDDFYMTRDSRHSLAQNIHPLLATRGVPGTHDMELMRNTLEALTQGRKKVSIPRFDKAKDDRSDTSSWESISAPADIVIMEGWCLGTPAQAERDLHKAVNEMEANEDPEGIWRKFVNQEITRNYEPVYQKIDVMIMLKAPSFNCVYEWRLEQEEKLRSRPEGTGQDENRVMSAAQVKRFIQHYQRLTEQSLNTLPMNVNYLYSLNSHRDIVNFSQPRAISLK